MHLIQRACIDIDPLGWCTVVRPRIPSSTPLLYPAVKTAKAFQAGKRKERLDGEGFKEVNVSVRRRPIYSVVEQGRAKKKNCAQGSAVGSRFAEETHPLSLSIWANEYLETPLGNTDVTCCPLQTPVHDFTAMPATVRVQHYLQQFSERR